jgi:hypothetical protein
VRTPFGDLVDHRTGNPGRGSMAAAVPRVATSWKPASCRSRAISTALGLSLSLTLMKTLPELGSLTLAASCALDEGFGEK